MSKECECSLRTKVLGDGCSTCNPSLALEHALEYIEELENRSCDNCRIYSESDMCIIKVVDFSVLNTIHDQYDFSCGDWEERDKD